MSIAASSLLVEVNISVWTANKLDKSETEKLLAGNSATRDAAKVHKNLMAGTSARKRIADFAAACRLWHNTQTLPWSDKGVRLIPTSLFFGYKQELNTRKTEFDKMVQNFLYEYPTLINDARANMGSLFNPEDYPSVEEVASNFAFRVTFSPVPEAGDFRLDIPTQDLEELSKQYENSFNTRIGEAMGDAWSRLHKVLTAMSDKLTEATGEKEKRFHNTFLTNAEELCAMLTHLNVTKDVKLEQARKQLEEVINGVSLESIKESPQVRAATKSKVDDVLKQFEW
jgi:hypothetical protein